MVDNYGEIYCYPEIREKDLGRIALSNANSIIDNVKIAFEHWHSIMDLFSTYQTFLVIWKLLLAVMLKQIL